MTDAQDWHDTDRLHAEQGRGDPFAAAVRATRMAMVITNPRKTDNPIVFANKAFLHLTGYAQEEVIGRNCRFLQGRDTDASAVRTIREAVDARRDVAVDLLNYRKDGTSFWNALYLSPVTSASGEVQFFFASQLDITDRVEVQLYLTQQRALLEREVSRRTRDLEAALTAREEALAAKTMLVHEVDHRVKNNLQMITAMLAMQARTERETPAGEALASVLHRIESIGTVHRRLYQATDVRRFDLSEFVRDIFLETASASGRDDIELSFDMEAISVSSQQASPLALMLNELLVNALTHAFPPGRPGRLQVVMHERDGRLIVSVADDGVGMPLDRSGSGFGSKLVEAIVRQLRGEVAWRRVELGTLVHVSVPLASMETAGGAHA